MQVIESEPLVERPQAGVVEKQVAGVNEKAAIFRPTAPSEAPNV